MAVRRLKQTWRTPPPSPQRPALHLDRLVSAYMVDNVLPVKDDGSGYGQANGMRSSAVGLVSGKYYTLTGYYLNGSSEAPVVQTAEGPALYFDGVNYKAGNAAHPSGWSGPVTLVARVLLNDTAGTHVVIGHFNSDQNPVYNYGAGIVISGGNVIAAGASGNARSIAAAAPATGRWVTLACVTNTAAGRLFVDDAKVASGDLSGAYSAYPFAIGCSGQQIHASANAYSLYGYVKHALVFAGDIGDAAIVDIARNLRKIYAPRHRRHLVSGAGGSALNLSGSGSSQASGTATPALQVALAGIGIAVSGGNAMAHAALPIGAGGSSVAGGSAVAIAAVPLSAAGIAQSSGSATPVATVTLTAAGLALAAAQAGIAAAVILQGAAAAQAAGNAALAAQLSALAAGNAQASGSANPTGGAQGSLAAAGAAQAAGDAALTALLQAGATGIARASGTASLGGGAPGILAAAGGAESSGGALMAIAVQLAAIGGSQAGGTGILGGGPLDDIAAAGEAAASGAAAMSASVLVSAAGFVHAMAAGHLAIEIPLAAIGQARAGATASALIVAPGLRLSCGISPVLMMTAGGRRPIAIRHEVRRV